ncbi:MAG: site-2 protease family protein [Bacteroidia bacterium]
MEYPSKPIPIPAPNVLAKTVFSASVFTAVYYFLLDQNMFNALSLVLVLTIHELGHFMAMKYFGYHDVQMMFMPLLGAYVSGEKEKKTEFQRVVVSLAGPVPGIILGFLLTFVCITADLPQLQPMANIFIFLNAFNLLPVIPLDGGRLIETLFAGSKEIILTVFIVISILLIVFLAWALGSYILLILILTLVQRLRNIWRIKAIREDMDEKQVEYRKSYSELSDEEFWKIRQVVENAIPASASGESILVSQVKAVLQDTPVKGLGIAGKLLTVLVWLIALILIPVMSVLLLYANNYFTGFTG